MDKYCPECGTERDAGNSFCAECGTQLSNSQSLKKVLLIAIPIITIGSVLFMIQGGDNSEVKNAEAPTPSSTPSTSTVSRPSSTPSTTYRESRPAPPPMQSYTFRCTKVCKTREGFSRTVEISNQFTVRARDGMDAYNEVDLRWRDYSICDNAGLDNLMTGGNEYCSQR